MINLPQLAERLQAAGVMNKAFADCSREEIETLCQAVLSSIGSDVPADGWKLPYITHSNQLVIPLDVHPEYRWWRPGGKSLRQVLTELRAPWTVARQYLEDDGLGHEMTERLWNDLLTCPF